MQDVNGTLSWVILFLHTSITCPPIDCSNSTRRPRICAIHDTKSYTTVSSHEHISVITQHNHDTYYIQGEPIFGFLGSEHTFDIGIGSDIDIKKYLRNTSLTLWCHTFFAWQKTSAFFDWRNKQKTANVKQIANITCHTNALQEYISILYTAIH